jgi:hypothetical protein
MIILEFILHSIFGSILNWIGGTLRWMLGSIWFSLRQKKNFKYSEYLFGPNNSDDWFDEKGHGFVNILAACVFIMTMILLFLK